MGLVLPARLQARQLVKMEYRRFLREIIEMPCQILRTGRRLVYRLLDVMVGAVFSWKAVSVETPASYLKLKGDKEASEGRRAG